MEDGAYNNNNEGVGTRASNSVRSSFLGDMSQSFANNITFQQALSKMEDKTNELHQKLNVVYIALLGFVFIGMCALGCVVFGVVEIVGGDQVFENEGFGEVLTVLGTFFSIPYVFLISLFLTLTANSYLSKVFGSVATKYSHELLMFGIVLLFVFQAIITNYYMVTLTNKYSLLITGFDLFALALILYYHKRDGRGFVFYNLVFAAKCAVLWGPAYETVKSEGFWGPNGILCMLFLSIPMCHFPMMVSYVRAACVLDANGNPIEPCEVDRRLLMEGQRQSNNNVPSTSMISQARSNKNNNSARMNGGASVASPIFSPSSPKSGYNEFNTPTNKNNDSSSGMLEGSNYQSGAISYSGTQNRFTAISGRTVQRLQRMAEAGFMDHFVSHFSLYLNHIMHTIDLIVLFNFAFIEPTTNSTQREAPLPFRVMIAILFCAGFFANHAAILHLFYNREDVQSANVPFFRPIIRAANRTLKTAGVANPDSDPKRSYQRRLFQYMLLMLAIVDIPLLICRLELWAGQYAPLSIFVAKNIKDIVDVGMLTLRVNENLRAEGAEEATGGGGGIRGSVPFGVPSAPARENAA